MSPQKKKESKTVPQLTPGQLRRVTGSGNEKLALRLIDHVQDSLWLPQDLSREEVFSRFAAAIALLKEIEPTDGLEGTLAVQMVATHSAAMECLKRAMIDGQSFAGRDLNLKHAVKLLNLYTRQLEVLNKHRGKGQQKVTVEHVNVGPGGQAIVGNVNGAGDGDKAAPSVPYVLNHNPGVGMDVNAQWTESTRPKRSAGSK